MGLDYYRGIIDWCKIASVAKALIKNGVEYGTGVGGSNEVLFWQTSQGKETPTN
jgi:hypothetical protein